MQNKQVNKKNGSKIIPTSLYRQAGMNPKNPKQPLRTIATPTYLKENAKRVLRVIDEQDAVNRYTWYNLPCNISGQELEKIIYYRGQVAFFYCKETNEFYFMPFALASKDGTGIDVYGRYVHIKPVPYAGGEEKKEKDRRYTPIELVVMNKQLRVHYSIPLQLNEDDLYKSAVILHDYTKQMGQDQVARSILNDPLVDLESEILCFMRTALIGGTGVAGMRVPDADSSENVDDANHRLLDCALKGKKWTAVTSAVEIQELIAGSVKQAQEYLLSLQSVDNLRLSTLGLENGGLFEKKAHLLESENDVNQANCSLIMEDGLKIRQNFCNIVNAIWGLEIWCEPSESYLQTDVDGDGDATDRNHGEKSGVNGSGGNNQAQGGGDNE